MRMENRAAEIIRWMERFQKSCRLGAMERALMDAECARADLEDLRLDVWSRVGRARTRFLPLGRLALVAGLLVLATATPLSRLAAVRARPAAAPLAEAEKPAAAEEPPAPKKARAAKARRAPVAKGGEARAASVKKSVPYDKVFSLMQTGARALKNEDSTIRIKKEKGEGIL